MSFLPSLVGRCSRANVAICRRRTKQSGPLGELFDHGVDALNTTLEVLIFAASQNMGQTWKTVATLFACKYLSFFRFLFFAACPSPPSAPPSGPLGPADELNTLPIQRATHGSARNADQPSLALLTFYVQTWDEYHTKTLTLGIVNGPVEGVLIVAAVFALTGYLGGAHIWQQSAFRALGVPASLGIPDFIYDLTFTDWYMVQGTIVLVFNTVESSINVIRARRARGDRSRGALLGLVPFFAVWALIVTYLYLQPNILHHHLIPFALFAGLVNAYSVGQMITAHLTKMPFPYWNVLGLLIGFGVVDSMGPVMLANYGVGWPSSLGDGVYQTAFVFLMLGTALGVYGSFVVDVIVTICDYLDIWCLTIKHPHDEATAAKPNGIKSH